MISDFLGVLQVDRNPLANAGDTVRSLVQEDSTCCGAIRPVCHNYWAHALEPRSDCWAHVLQLLKPLHLEDMLRNKRGHKIRSQCTAARERLHSIEDLGHPKKEWIPCLFASTCTLYLSQLFLYQTICIYSFVPYMDCTLDKQTNTSELALYLGYFESPQCWYW